MKGSLIYIAGLLIILQACGSSSNKIVNQKETMNLEQDFSKINYRDLFYFDSELIDSIWNDGENEIDLQKIVLNNDFGDHDRFLAAEIFFEKSGNIPKDLEWNKSIAYIYTKAMKNPMLPANPWGFMYHLENNGTDGSGKFGTHLLSSGNISIPFLTPLLEDASHFLPYEGSRDATLGNSLNYRINDVAAYYLHKITNIPIQFYPEISKRDEELELFKKQLNNRK